MKVTFNMDCDGYTEDILRRKLTAALDRGAFELGFHEDKKEEKVADVKKENLEESLRLNLEFIEKLKASLENAERSSEFWKSLYNSEKEDWVNRWVMAIQNCRDFGLTDHAVRNLFEIQPIGTLDGYIKDVQKFSKTLDGYIKDAQKFSKTEG